MKEPFKRSGLTFYTYVVECADGTYYTGYTNDLGRRIERHNKGVASKYTRIRLPVRLVWSKTCKNQRFAMRTEKILKKLKREDKKCIIQGARIDNILRKYKNL